MRARPTLDIDHDLHTADATHKFETLGGARPRSSCAIPSDGSFIAFLRLLR
jgi:hypothetical protein